MIFMFRILVFNSVVLLKCFVLSMQTIVHLRVVLAIDHMLYILKHRSNCVCLPSPKNLKQFPHGLVVIVIRRELSLNLTTWIIIPRFSVVFIILFSMKIHLIVCASTIHQSCPGILAKIRQAAYFSPEGTYYSPGDWVEWQSYSLTTFCYFLLKEHLNILVGWLQSAINFCLFHLEEQLQSFDKQRSHSLHLKCVCF